MAVELLTRTTIHPPVETPGIFASAGDTVKTVVYGGTTVDHSMKLGGVIIDRDRDVMEIPLDKVPILERTTSVGGNALNITTSMGLLTNHEVTLVTPSPSAEAVVKANERGVKVVALRPDEGEGKIKDAIVLNSADDPGERAIIRETPKRSYDVPTDEIENHDLIVLSSLDGERWRENYRNVAKGAKDAGKILAVLPASEQMKDPGNEDLQYAIEKSDILCANKRELIKLMRGRDKKVDAETSMLDLILMAADEYGYDPDTKQEKEIKISVTDGGNPALLYAKGVVYELAPFGDKAEMPLGAGDGLAAKTLAALAEGKQSHEALIEGSIEGYNVTLHEDAQTGHQTREQIAAARAENPDYIPTIIYSKKDHQQQPHIPAQISHANHSR